MLLQRKKGSAVVHHLLFSVQSTSRLEVVVQMHGAVLFWADAASPVSLVSAVAVATPSFIHLPVPFMRVKF